MSPFPSIQARDAAISAERGYQEVHPLDWRDDFGPLQYSQFNEFVRHLQPIEAASEDINEEHRRCVHYGYRDVLHFRRVRTTFLKYWGEPGDSPTLDEFTWKEPELSNAILLGVQLDNQEKMQAAVTSNPNLTAPEEGLTLEQYAGICARIAGSQVSPAELQQILAPYAFDIPKWERVNRRWMERMQADRSNTITIKFTQGFAAAGAGKYGAAAKAASVAMATPGAAPEGPEPISLELYAELSARAGSWTSQGMDTNAMFIHHYQMNASDLSNVGMYWQARFVKDLALFDRYKAMVDRNRKRFDGPSADSDLVF